MSRHKIILAVVIILLSTYGYILIRMHNNGYIKLLFVHGNIVDEQGNAIPNATVQAHFGIIKEGNPALTTHDGIFNVYVYNTKSYMLKGPPIITISKAGYNEKWIYYEDWYLGPRMAQERIILHKDIIK